MDKKCYKIIRIHKGILKLPTDISIKGSSNYDRSKLAALLYCGLVETAYIINPNSIRYYIVGFTRLPFITKIPFSLEDYLG